MDRIKKVFALIHLFIWILYTLFLSWVFWSEGHAFWFTLALGLVLSSLFVFYSHLFLMAHYLRKGRYRFYFLGLLGVLLTGPFPSLLLQEEELNTLPLFLDQYVTTILSLVLIFIILSWLARFTENWFLNAFEREQLKKQAAEAELHYLKSQINPHFLFNTLHNIHTLVYKQAATAPEAVLRLASLMRYMIYESNAPTVPLSREMDFLQDYVSLQQLRYKKSPVVDLAIKGDTGACAIAPLLFIHLLENAYKHSPARLEPGDIKVSIEVKENTLTFQIENPISTNQGNTLEEPGGIGLPNVRKRLALLYPGQHQLEINSSAEKFSIILKIHGLPLQAHERETHLLYN